MLPRGHRRRGRNHNLPVPLRQKDLAAHIFRAPVAQWIEQWFPKPLVGGPTPPGGTKHSTQKGRQCQTTAALSRISPPPRHCTLSPGNTFSAVKNAPCIGAMQPAPWDLGISNEGIRGIAWRENRVKLSVFPCRCASPLFRKPPPAAFFPFHEDHRRHSLSGRKRP